MAKAAIVIAGSEMIVAADTLGFEFHCSLELLHLQVPLMLALP